MSTVLKHALSLSVEDRLELIEELWYSLVATPEAELDLDDDRLHPTPSGGLSARRFHNASRPTSALPVRHLLRNRQAGDRRLRCVPWRSRPGTLATTPTRRIKQAVGADRLRR